MQKQYTSKLFRKRGWRRIYSSRAGDRFSGSDRCEPNFPTIKSQEFRDRWMSALSRAQPKEETNKNLAALALRPSST